MVSSIYKKTIINYHLLHPKLQKRYQLDRSHTFSGRGTMSEISGGSFFVRMLLKCGVFFRCFFSERGKDIPFTIKNRTCLTKQEHTGIEWNRTFLFKDKKRFFDAVMVYDENEKRILDFFGQPHILLSVLTFEALSDGSLHITSGKQWLLICEKKFLCQNGWAVIPLFAKLLMKATTVSLFKFMWKMQFWELFFIIKGRFRKQREKYVKTKRHH